MNFDTEVKQYLKRLSKALPHDIPDRKRLLSDIEHNLRTYIQEHPSVTWEEVIGEFGRAEELADSILSGLPASEVVASLHKQKRSYTLLILAGILLLLLCACIAGYIINWERTDHVIRLEPHYILDGTEVTSEEFQRKKNK